MLHVYVRVYIHIYTWFKLCAPTTHPLPNSLVWKRFLCAHTSVYVRMHLNEIHVDTCMTQKPKTSRFVFVYVYTYAFLNNQVHAQSPFLSWGYGLFAHRHMHIRNIRSYICEHIYMDKNVFPIFVHTYMNIYIWTKIYVYTDKNVWTCASFKRCAQIWQFPQKMLPPRNPPNPEIIIVDYIFKLLSPPTYVYNIVDTLTL